MRNGCFPLRLVLGFFVSAASVFGPATANARETWQEMHESSDDVHIDVDSSGIATIRHHLRYRVVAGHFKAFDLAGVGTDPRELTTETTFTSEKGNSDTTPARIEPNPKVPGSIRIVIDEGKGLGRGSYVVDVAYKIDLVATKLLVKDGALWKLTWTAAPVLEGRDGARVIFGVPSAPTEPRLAGESTTTLATLRRAADRDELELVRPHIPKGEATAWSIRVDPKGFPQVTSPDLRAAPSAPAAPQSWLVQHLFPIVAGTLLFGIFVGLSLLLRAKQRSVREVATMREARADMVLGVPWGLGPYAYGATTTAALAALLWFHPLAGAALVVLALALACHRPPKAIAKPRRPGSWQPVAEPEVLLPPPTSPLPTDGLDISTRRGLLALGGIVFLAVVTCAVLYTRVPQIALALPLTFAAVLPIFATGTRAQLFPTPTELAAQVLRPARDALASKVDLAHVEIGTIGRVVGGEVDEVRLSCAPRDRTPGFKAIEVAVVGQGAAPEILVRYDAGSHAAKRIARFAGAAHPLAGRSAEEKVVRLVPEECTPVSTADLVGRLLSALEGRRATDRNSGKREIGRFKGVERRLPAPC